MNIFGFELKKAKKDTDSSIAIPQPDGALDIVDGGISGTAANSLYSYNFDVSVADDVALIQQYRDISMLSEVDDAIDEIVNEAVVVQDQQEIVELNLAETNFSENVKKKIIEEFSYILGLLNFHDNGDQIFRQWYIDGRQYYHKVVDAKKEKEGITSIDWLDPVKTKKIREIERKKNGEVDIKVVKEEYFLYDPSLDTDAHGNQLAVAASPAQEILKLSPDSVCYCTCGIMDLKKGQVLSYLHKAVKPANMLALMEDSLVVSRLVRAPERRIFYVDIGKLGASRADQYMRNIMNRYRNRITYDIKTGKVENNNAHLSMMEDIWLPRMEGGRGTQVDTLPGANNLGDIEDVLFFRKKLAKALKLPASRADSENSVFNVGVSGEITRDEMKFSKYVDKVRRRFNTFFYDLLKTQLLLKQIITQEDWDDNKHNIGIIYNRDSYISELQKAEMWRQRFELLQQSESIVGKDKYLSQRWVRDNILRLSEEEQKQMEKDWAEEPEVEEEEGNDSRF